MTKVDPRYAALIQWILADYDSARKLADKPLATDWARGEAAGLEGVLTWLQGFEHTDLEGLRKMVAEHS